MQGTSQGGPCTPLCLPQSTGAQSQAVGGPGPAQVLPLFSDGSNAVFCFNSFTVFVSFIVSFLKSFPDL